MKFLNVLVVASLFSYSAYASQMSLTQLTKDSLNPHDPSANFSCSAFGRGANFRAQYDINAPSNEIALMIADFYLRQGVEVAIKDPISFAAKLLGGYQIVCQSK